MHLLKLLIPILFLLFACGPSELEIEKSYETVVVEGYSFQDSLIEYQLTSDSLILNFNKESLINEWYLEIILDDRTTETDHDHIVNKKAFTPNKHRLTITGINLAQPDSTSIYLFGTPGGEAEMVFKDGEPIGPIKYEDMGGFLKTIDYWKWDSIQLYCLKKGKFDSLPGSIKPKVFQTFLDRMNKQAIKH